ncbi:MAG TPA: NUDIX hydrolase [Actinocrinis sp.]|nr:NUDIX hydrolase [Actinocrinis sp.]
MITHQATRQASTPQGQSRTLSLIKRTRPNSAPYWVTIGVGREPQDADLAGTVRREAMEEAGADLHVVMQVLVLTDHHPGGGIAIQHFFLATLGQMDPARRTGSEFAKPERGTYEIDRVPFTDNGLAGIDLRPPGLAAYLRENWAGLAASCQEQNP